MTPRQRREFDDDGYTVIEDFFSAEELARLLGAVDEVAAQYRAETGASADEPFQCRNLLSRHDAFLDLVDHPRMLPLVVDAMGTDIQIRTSHLDYRPPYPEGLRVGAVGMSDGEDANFATGDRSKAPGRAGFNNVSWHPDLAPQLLLPQKGGPAEGFLPFMECKAFYPLFDMTASGCGNLWLAKGSHRRPKDDLAARTAAGQQPEEAVELRLPAGAAVLWRTAVWHCVGPQTSDQIRKILHIGYHHRWLRPTDYLEQAPELLARCSPVRRQLLGALPEGRDPLGSHGNVDWAPASKHWQPHEDDVPLRAEAQRWAAVAAAAAAAARL